MTTLSTVDWDSGRIVAERWVVVWWSPERREALFSDRALALAYAAAHRGVLVPMIALGEWPAQPVT